MALESWLASLKSDVSNVSGVQVSIHAGLDRYVTETADVSGVASVGCIVVIDTAATASEKLTYQAQPAWTLGCTADTSDTLKKINTYIQTTEVASSPTKTEPRLLISERRQWLTSAEHLAAQAYHGHHFNCCLCISAGKGIGYGQRCNAGLAFWKTYIEAKDSSTEKGQHD